VNLQEAPKYHWLISPWGVKKGWEGLQIDRLKSEDLPNLLLFIAFGN